MTDAEQSMSQGPYGEAVRRDAPMQRVAQTDDGLLRGSVGQIPVTLQIVLGSAKMRLDELETLGPGSIVRLDRRVGEPVDILVNGKWIGKGEISIVEGDEPRFAIAMTDVGPDARKTPKS
jgi:flagellar motor switch protein FliN